jgi:hypothetical protein
MGGTRPGCAHPPLRPCRGDPALGSRRHDLLHRVGINWKFSHEEHGGVQYM